MNDAMFIKAQDLKTGEDVLIPINKIETIGRVNRAERYAIINTVSGASYEIGWSNDKAYTSISKYIITL